MSLPLIVYLVGIGLALVDRLAGRVAEDAAAAGRSPRPWTSWACLVLLWPLLFLYVVLGMLHEACGRGRP